MLKIHAWRSTKPKNFFWDQRIIFLIISEVRTFSAKCNLALYNRSNTYICVYNNIPRYNHVSNQIIIEKWAKRDIWKLGLYDMITAWYRSSLSALSWTQFHSNQVRTHRYTHNPQFDSYHPRRTIQLVTLFALIVLIPRNKSNVICFWTASFISCMIFLD